ncbi:hypothetical protein Ctob_016619, partial [Chrysochromulina tobinii]
MYASVLVPKTGKGRSKAASHHVVTINRKFTSRKETYEERLAEAAAELNNLIWATLKPFMADHKPQKRQRVGSAGAGSAGSAAAEESEKASEGSDDEDNSPPTHHGRGGARGGAGATPVEVHWQTGLPSGNSRYYKDKIKIGFLRGEAFLDEGNIEALYDDRCKKRSDCISDEQ